MGPCITVCVSEVSWCGQFRGGSGERVHICGLLELWWVMGWWEVVSVGVVVCWLWSLAAGVSEAKIRVGRVQVEELKRERRQRLV